MLVKEKKTQGKNTQMDRRYENKLGGSVEGGDERHDPKTGALIHWREIGNFVPWGGV